MKTLFFWEGEGGSNTFRITICHARGRSLLLNDVYNFGPVLVFQLEF